MSRNYKYEEQNDSRDYGLEARNLVRGLKGSQVYEMYEIVIKKLQRGNSDTRDKELTAVRDAIEATRAIDTSRLRRLKYGFKSEMAATANPRDGFTKPAKKKV
tara:strand:+ start:149 stop:457 length:309 start_codon:yes stop_codon:yes gene_type:complete